MIQAKKNLSKELSSFLNDQFGEEIISKYKQRIEQGAFTIQENPESHFCVYFAAYDSKIKKLFLGHHKKSGLWLFNGGHIDKGETISETLVREIDEEWGLDADVFNIEKPKLLTITEINNPTKQTCRYHYDIWYFIAVNRGDFKPIPEKLSEEFYKIDWMTRDEAKNLVTDPGTLKGIDFIADNYFDNNSAPAEFPKKGQ